MSEPIKGSVELIINPADPNTAISQGIVVEQATTDAVPGFIAMVYGIPSLDEAPLDLDPQTNEPVVGQIAVWTGTDLQARPAKVVLWREVAPQPRQVEETP